MALTRDRNTLEKLDGVLTVLPVAAAVQIFAGSLVAVNAEGHAVPAAATAGLKAAGRAQDYADNRNDAAGIQSIRVKRGVFKYKNSTTHPLTAANLYENCYIQDDETVRANDTDTGAVNIVAGKVFEIESDGVWVEIR